MRGYGDAKNSEGISRRRQNIRLCEKLVTCSLERVKCRLKFSKGGDRKV
jgi:hypothetical protein